MIPQINANPINNLNVVAYSSKTYNDNEYELSNYIDGLDSIKQTIYDILRTERYAYVIYTNDYGVELMQFMTKSFDYLKANIRRVLEDALLQDDRINSIDNVSINQASIDSATIEFTVNTSLGNITEVVNINHG